MSVWSKIIAVARAILGIEKDVDRIMKPFVKVANELHQFAEKQQAQAAKDTTFAQQLQDKSAMRCAEADRAKSLAANVGGLL